MKRSEREVFLDGLLCGAGIVMIRGATSLQELEEEARLKFPAVDEPAGGTQFCPPLHTKDELMRTVHLKPLDPRGGADTAGPRIPSEREVTDVGRGEGAGVAVDKPSRERLDYLDFSVALQRLRQGEAVARRGWNGKGQYLGLQTPDHQSKMTLPYLYIVTVDAHRVPWLASQTDLLAHDWCVVRRVGDAVVYGEPALEQPVVIPPARH